MRRAWVLSLLVAGACTPAAPVCPAARGEAPWDGAQLIAVARVDDGVRVRGLSGAVPPGTTVRVAHPTEEQEVIADEDGRFLVELDAAEGEVLVDAGEVGRATFPVRELDDALACVAGRPVEVGTTPNDLALMSCGDDLLALVPASSDGALEAVALQGSRAPPAVIFPVDDAARFANPFALALEPDGGRAGVTLFGQHAVAVVDACAGRLLSAATAGELVEVDPPLELSAPLDADGDGARETTVERMLPRHPQGVVFADSRLLVSFTNLLEAGPPARFGPGLVVAFDIEDGELRAAEQLLLPFDNPQSMGLDDEGRPWASCSGVLERGEHGWGAATPGGLVRLSARPLAVEEALPLETFAPGTPAFVDGAIVVGSLLSSRIAHLAPGAGGLDDATVFTPPGAELESFFVAAPLGGGLVGVTQFSADAVHVIDARTGELGPWPFTAPLTLARGEAFRGAKALAPAPRRARTHGAPDAAVLLEQSSEVVPLHLWQVLGP